MYNYKILIFSTQYFIKIAFNKINAIFKGKREYNNQQLKIKIIR